MNTPDYLRFDSADRAVEKHYEGKDYDLAKLYTFNWLCNANFHNALNAALRIEAIICHNKFTNYAHANRIMDEIQMTIDKIVNKKPTKKYVIKRSPSKIVLSDREYEKCKWFDPYDFWVDKE